MNKGTYRLLALGILPIVALLVIVGAAGAAPKGGVTVDLKVAQSEFRASEDVLVTVTLSNRTKQPARILKWLTPTDGVDASRIIFAGKRANPVHLARYPLADLFLDTAPYGAHHSSPAYPALRLRLRSPQAGLGAQKPRAPAPTGLECRYTRIRAGLILRAQHKFPIRNSLTFITDRFPILFIFRQQFVQLSWDGIDRGLLQFHSRAITRNQVVLFTPYLFVEFGEIDAAMRASALFAGHCAASYGF